VRQVQLIHLPRKVELFGELNNSSAFEFENYMQTLKKYAGLTRDPVLQVSCRLEEYRACIQQSNAFKDNNY
jgi:hypothetical protein